MSREDVGERACTRNRGRVHRSTSSLYTPCLLCSSASLYASVCLCVRRSPCRDAFHLSGRTAHTLTDECLCGTSACCIQDRKGAFSSVSSQKEISLQRRVRERSTLHTRWAVVRRVGHGTRTHTRSCKTRSLRAHVTCEQSSDGAWYAQTPPLSCSSERSASVRG